MANATNGTTSAAVSYTHLDVYKRQIQECGVDEKVFFDNLPRLADNAHADQCTTANPRYPLVSEIEQLYTDAYYGR